MYTSQIVAVALTAVAGMIQTCPAPFAAPLFAAGAALTGGGGQKRSDIVSNLDKCVQDGRAATEQVQITSDDRVIMDGVPASCMQEVDTWNAHPHLAHLEKDYGSVKKLNSTAIEFDGLPKKTIDWIESVMTKPQ